MLLRIIVLAATLLALPAAVLVLRGTPGPETPAPAVMMVGKLEVRPSDAARLELMADVALINREAKGYRINELMMTAYRGETSIATLIEDGAALAVRSPNASRVEPHHDLDLGRYTLTIPAAAGADLVVITVSLNGGGKTLHPALLELPIIPAPAAPVPAAPAAPASR